MESEARTRKTRIDIKLQEAGWSVVPFNEGMNLSLLAHHAIEEYPTANGPADYALVSAGRLVGVIEAKKVTVGPRSLGSSGTIFPRT